MLLTNLFFSIDARRIASQKAEELRKKTAERELVRAQELAGEAESRRKQDEELATKEAEERSKRVADQEKELNRIVEDKERRERDAKESSQRRDAAMVLVAANKAKKEGMRREKAIAAAQAKVELKTVELEAKTRQAENEALQKVEKERLKRLHKEEKAAKKLQMIEDAFSEMEEKLANIEESAKQATKRAAERDYKITKDDSDDDDDDDIALAQAKSAALRRASELEAKTTLDLSVDGVKSFEDVDLEFDVADGDVDDFEDVEKKRLEIEARLMQSKEEARNKAYVIEEDVYVDDIALAQSRASNSISAKKLPAIKPSEKKKAAKTTKKERSSIPLKEEKRTKSETAKSSKLENATSSKVENNKGPKAEKEKRIKTEKDAEQKKLKKTKSSKTDVTGATKEKKAKSTKKKVAEGLDI